MKDFEHMLEDAFNKLENGEIESFKFPGTLSKGIFTESSGTFPRCVTISKLEKKRRVRKHPEQRYEVKSKKIVI